MRRATDGGGAVDIAAGGQAYSTYLLARRLTRNERRRKQLPQTQVTAQSSRFLLCLKGNSYYEQIAFAKRLNNFQPLKPFLTLKLFFNNCDQDF